ncbi:pirin [Actinosynnema sp. ALI-1.44]|uniref:pirin family protein n=1 Tax=Actinosynnema sp. ALI-1.44 TaxID=1933779 RepID=UPI00097C8505|nr:pirin family protein [Actinosynnema sp. ALI-1.44]ONI74644.1 pirin [Actinosynnema sp. ALI-1.44]
MSDLTGPEYFEAREVPLGGVRGVQVDRILPQRELPTLGAWCFLDQFGPDVAKMVVLPHPHIGLQTVTWPLSGEIRHRDSVGSDVILRPGQLNLMTSGRGVSHSEVSVGTGPLHALQLWVALPAEATGMPAAFEHHPSLPHYQDDGIDALVFMGALGDVESPATTYTPLVGAQLEITEATVPLRPDFEYGLLVLDGAVRVAGVEVKPGPLLYLGTGRDSLTMTGPARAVLLGGEPFPDDLVMWWNFVGRDHDEIAAARADWEANAERGRFGAVAGHGSDRIPAPILPNLRLKPRRQPTRG